MNEWRKIPGFGTYEVSEDGAVRRAVPTKQGRHVGAYMKFTVDGHGYPTATVIGDDGKAHRLRVHVAVLLAFFGPRPDGHDASHLNGVKTENNIENLRWEPRRDNIMRKLEHGTMIRGSAHKCSKLQESDIPKIRKALCDGRKPAHIGAEFGVSRTVISNIRHGHSWAHVQ